MKRKKRRYEMPPQIPDTPENVAKAMMRTPPRKADEWKYLQKREEEENMKER